MLAFVAIAAVLGGDLSSSSSALVGLVVVMVDVSGCALLQAHGTLELILNFEVKHNATSHLYCNGCSTCPGICGSLRMGFFVERSLRPVHCEEARFHLNQWNLFKYWN